MRTFRILIFSIISLWFIQESKMFAQRDSVRIYGSSPEYKNMTLVLETIKNYVTREKSEVGRVKIDSRGYFDGYFFVAFSQKCFLDLGKFRAFIYLEPGKTYKVVLPPFYPRSEADRFNPFYEPEEVVLGIANSDVGGLNEKIRDFDEKFRHEFNINAYQLFNKSNVKKADQIKAELDSLFPSKTGTYFDTHKTYRYARLYMLAMRRKKRSVIYQFYSKRPIEFKMPAYWETYSELFKDFFSYYFNSSTGRNLRSAISNRESFNSLSLVMSEDTLYKQSDFRESLILKGLYDSYFSGRYNEETVLGLIEQATNVGGSPQICSFASEMLFRINRLRVGTDAPDFKVFGMNGDTFSLDEYKGDFVYLSFIHTENYGCKKDLKILSIIAKEFKRDLKVISVILDNSPEKGFQYMKQNKYQWDISHYGGNGKILLDYNIKALPVYYLIDPDGKLVLSPAPAPEENFIDYFSNELKDYKIKQARSKQEKRRSIYDL